MSYNFNPFTGNFDDVSVDTTDIGDTIGNSPATDGVLYVDSSGTLQNNLIKVQATSYFGGAVVGQEIFSTDFSNPRFGFVDLSGIGQPSGLAFATNSSTTMQTFWIDTDSLTAYGLMSINPASPASSQFILGFGTGGVSSVQSFLVSGSSASFAVPLGMNSQKISSLADPTSAQDAVTLNHFDTKLAGTTNTTSFTPTSDYHVATKKYVDDNTGGSSAGGSDTQLQFNDDSDFGGAVWVYDSTVGTLTGSAVADLTGTGSQDLFVIKDEDDNDVFQMYEERSGSTITHLANMGYLKTTSTDYHTLYEQDATNRTHWFRGLSTIASQSFGIRIDTGNQVYLDTGYLTINPTNSLTLKGNTLIISAGESIGHANLQLKTSNGAGFYQAGSNSRRNIKISNAASGTDSSVQLAVETDSASYTPLRVNAGVTTPTADIMQVRRNGTDKFVVDKDGYTKIVDRVGFYNTTPSAQSTGWSVSNLTTDKSYDADSTTTDELADVLGTLISELKTKGLIAA